MMMMMIMHAADTQCKMVNALPVLCITAGIYTMVIVSIERVRCVLPAPGHEVPSPDARSIGVRGTLIALAVVWTLSVVVAVPAAVNFDVGSSAQEGAGGNQSLVVCQATWNSLQTTVYSMFVLVASYLMPQVAHIDCFYQSYKLVSKQPREYVIYMVAQKSKALSSVVIKSY